MTAVSTAFGRIECAILEFIKTPSELVNREYMKSVLSAHGFSETLFEPVTDLMVEDGYLKGVVSKRTGEVFGYWMTEDGYRRKNKLVREFGEALVVKAK